MIFSKRKDKSKLILNWDGKIIERVSNYVYLGVPFTEQLNWEFVKNFFVKKTENALKDLKALIFRSKMNHFDSILSLFNSLVRSVFSYCAPVWGVNFADSFEKLRSSFLKSLFLLPTSIPNWFLRLELGLYTSELFFVKLCLKFMVRLASKKKDTLMYKAYDTMTRIDSYKKCWFVSIKKLCEKWNCQNILNLINDDTLSSGSKIVKINQGICFIEQDSISLDIVKMRQTKLLRVYMQNKSHCLKESYLNDNYTWGIKQLIFQLKLGISHLTHKGIVARIRCLEFKYGYVSDSACQLCGIENESTYHILFKCPHYVTERVKYIHSLSLYKNDYEEEDYLKMFNNLSESDAFKLFNFFNCSLTRRRLYQEEFDSMSS